MATNGYTRQGTFNNGDVIDEAHHNNEYDQLAIAFNKDTGHTHDGTAGQGTAIPLIKHVASGTQVNAGVDEVTFDIEGAVGLITCTKGALGEALINGQDMAQIAQAVHIHAISDTTGLQSALNLKSDITYVDSGLSGKSAVGHGHVIGDVTDLQNELNGKTNVAQTNLKADITYVDAQVGTKANTVHTHVINDTTGLQAALDSKADSVDNPGLNHNHAVADVTGLQAELNAKNHPTLNPVDWDDINNKPIIAPGLHGHTIGEVTNLQTELDAKYSASNVPPSANINWSYVQVTPTTLAGYGITDAASDTELTNGLAGKVDDAQVLTNVPLGALFTDTNTTYSIQDGQLSEISFTSADHSKLNGIATSANNYSHPASHAISFITGLQTALDAKSPTGHTHGQADITNLTSDLSTITGNISTNTTNITTASTTLKDSAATQTIVRTTGTTLIIDTSASARTYTLDESTFSTGDIVEIDVLLAGTTTVTTDTGTIYLPDGTFGSSHVLTGAQGLIRLYKYNSTNWRLRVYA